MAAAGDRPTSFVESTTWVSSPPVVFTGMFAGRVAGAQAAESSEAADSARAAFASMRPRRFAVPGTAGAILTRAHGTATNRARTGPWTARTAGARARRSGPAP